MTFSDWGFGTDTNATGTFPCTGKYANFYIGPIGGETTASTANFSDAAAEAVGVDYTFSYWDLAGPGSAPTGDTPTEWGVAQANAFISAWEDSDLVGGTTLFADIEPGNGGWGTDTAENQAVLHAFLVTINASFTAGVYISSDNWTSYFGDYTSTEAFVLWLAGADCSITTCAEAETAFNDDYTDTSLGGYRVMIWQYVIGSCSGATQDLDITPYNGYESGTWNPTAA